MFWVQFHERMLRENTIIDPPAFTDPPFHPNPTPSFGSFEQDNFESDDFRMYSYKIKKCPLRQNHDWTICPYTHRGEKTRRRDPRVYPYLALPCPDFKPTLSGSCPKGDLCGCAHGVFEYWLHPTKYRTRMCNARGFCTRPVCFFAHSPLELRVPAIPLLIQKWFYDALHAKLQARAAAAEWALLVQATASATAAASGGGGGGGGVGVIARPKQKLLQGHASSSTSDDQNVASNGKELGLNLEFLESLKRLRLNEEYNNYLRNDGSLSNSNVNMNEPNIKWVCDLIAG